MPVAEDVDLDDLAEATEGFAIAREHFESALEKVEPSVTAEMREFYDWIVDDLGGVSIDALEEAPAGFQ